jgi:hypothetical protein
LFVAKVWECRALKRPHANNGKEGSTNGKEGSSALATLKGLAMLTVGDKFPRFEAQACVSLEKNGFKRIHNDTFKGKWVVYLL